LKVTGALLTALVQGA